MNYATVNDVEDLWREMTQAERKRAEPLIEIISASLRAEARKVGKDLDKMTNDIHESGTDDTGLRVCPWL